MSIRRGAITTLVFQWGSYALQLVSLIVLARILLPADYGLITMAGAIIGIASVIGDFGLSLASIQARELSQQQKSNLFWINTLIGVGVGALVAVGSPLIAGFYGEPRLVWVSIALGSVFALNGIAVQFRVELNRSLRFGALGATDLSAQVLALVTAITLGVLGAGYWALVAQQVLAAAGGLVVSAVLARWRPTRPGRLSETRRLLAFGRDTFLLQIANYVTSNLDSVMVGRWSGPVALGVYNRAFQVAVLPMQQLVAPLTRVFLPRLSAAEGDEFTRLLHRLQLLLVTVMTGPLSLLLALSDPLPVFLFGPSWSPLGEILRVLALNSFFGVLAYIYYWAFLARGRTMTLFFSEMCGRVPTVVLILLLAPLGPVWVAASVLIGQVIIWITSTFVFGRKIDIAPLPVLRQAVRPVIVFAFAFGSSSVIRTAFGLDAPTLLTIVTLSAAWVAAVFACLLIPAVRSDARNILDVVRPGR